MALKLEAILFDLDGVLVDACDWHYEALNLALVDAGFSGIDIESHFAKYNGLPTKVKLKMLGISDHLSDQINKNKQKYTLDIIKTTAKIMTDKIELHDYLKKQGIKIGCVTNSIEQTAKEMLLATGQLPYIDLLVSNEMVSKNKPYPDCYNYAIQLLDVDPVRTLCVEDSPKGIEAAKNSIAKYIWIVKNPNDVTLENYHSFLEKN
jgi:HAD superfamily hydrolase (TIGR01509 family)